MHTLEITDGYSVTHIGFTGSPTLDGLLSGTPYASEHPCGGKGICGKCAVDIRGMISAPSARENELGVRLSCHVRLFGDAVLRVKALPFMAVAGAADAVRPLAEGHEAVAAADIGTTTVVLRVLDAATGEVLFSGGCRNPQRDISADVIGRISAASDGHASDLRSAVTGAVSALADRSGYRMKISRYVITGNTTMLYLLTGRDPSSLGVSPFLAECLFGIGWSFDGRPAYLPCCIHAFAGADLTCAILASELCGKECPALLCDIGTNGEIALYTDGRLLVTSVAAGPAFEGAGIRCGCAGIEGAISKVFRENGSVSFRTIGGILPAVGLCGSGVLDAAAYALDTGLADETGAMKDPLVITDLVTFTPADLRAVQTAKAAIAAGIAKLLKVAGIAESDIRRFIICGGFGSAADLRSAVRIGLFPPAFLRVAECAGNAALDGACRLLTDPGAAGLLASLAKNARHVDLGGDPEFNNLFIDNMMFPE